MRVEHGKLDLEIVQPRVRGPSALGVIPRNARFEDLLGQVRRYIPGSLTGATTHDIFVDGIILAR